MKTIINFLVNSIRNLKNLFGKNNKKSKEFTSYFFYYAASLPILNPGLVKKSRFISLPTFNFILCNLLITSAIGGHYRGIFYFFGDKLEFLFVYYIIAASLIALIDNINRSLRGESWNPSLRRYRIPLILLFLVAFFVKYDCISFIFGINSGLSIALFSLNIFDYLDSNSGLSKSVTSRKMMDESECWNFSPADPGSASTFNIVRPEQLRAQPDLDTLASSTLTTSFDVNAENALRSREIGLNQRLANDLDTLKLDKDREKKVTDIIQNPENLRHITLVLATSSNPDIRAIVGTNGGMSNVNNTEAVHEALVQEVYKVNRIQKLLDEKPRGHFLNDPAYVEKRWLEASLIEMNDKGGYNIAIFRKIINPIARDHIINAYIAAQVAQHIPATNAAAARTIRDSFPNRIKIVDRIDQLRSQVNWDV